MKEVYSTGAVYLSRNLPQAQHQQAVSGASSLSVSVAQFAHHPLKPYLGSRYHVHPNEARLRLSVHRDRLGEPSGAVMAIATTLAADFRIEAVQEATNKHGKSDIFNTDQGCQFTSLEFTGLLEDSCIQISMDGKGSWRDNVFVERLWKSVKYEEYIYTPTTAYVMQNKA